MAEVREKCAALETEVSTLRLAIEKLGAESSTAKYAGKNPNRTYARAVQAAP